MTVVDSSLECPTCGSPRRGPYCAVCGERFLLREDLEIGHFLHKHFVREVFDLDGRLGRTLRVVFFKPGQLAADFIAGRRQGFLSPLRLYLTIFLAHAFLSASIDSHGMSVPERVGLIDVFGVLKRLMASRPTVDWSKPELQLRLTARAHWLSEFATLMVFFGVAVVQALVFHRLRRKYLEHVALALNVSAFFMAIVFASELVVAIAWPHRFVQTSYLLQQLFALVCLSLYWILAVRRFYGLRTAPAVVGGLAVTVGNWLVAIVLNVVLLAVLIETA